MGRLGESSPKMLPNAVATGTGTPALSLFTSFRLLPFPTQGDCRSAAHEDLQEAPPVSLVSAFPTPFPLSFHLVTPTSSPFSASRLFLACSSIFYYLDLFISLIAHFYPQWEPKAAGLILLSSLSSMKKPLLSRGRQEVSPWKERGPSPPPQAGREEQPTWA